MHLLFLTEESYEPEVTTLWGELENYTLRWGKIKPLENHKTAWARNRRLAPEYSGIHRPLA
jgi:hypothetical protein